MAINSILSTAVSGLHKNTQRVQESANKIVNAGAVSSPLEVAGQQPALSGNTAINAQLSGSGDVNLVREFANLIEAKAAYSANAQVVRTADDLSKLSQDILA